MSGLPQGLIGSVLVLMGKDSWRSGTALSYQTCYNGLDTICLNVHVCLGFVLLFVRNRAHFVRLACGLTVPRSTNTVVVCLFSIVTTLSRTFVTLYWLAVFEDGLD